jgi:hypothetical protein
MLTINTVGPTIMNSAARSRRSSSCPRSWPARSTSASATPSPTPGPTWPPCRPRPWSTATSSSSTGQDLHQPGRRRRLLLAGRPDRPRGLQAQGHLHGDRAHGHPGVRVVPMQLLGDHNINYTFWEDVRVPVSNVVGGINNGWSLITNQLNHERVTLCSPGIIERALGDVSGLGPADQAGRRPAGHRPGVGAAAPGPGLRQARVPEADQLEGGLAGDPGSSRRGRRLVSIKVFGTEFYMEALRTSCPRWSARPAT